MSPEEIIKIVNIFLTTTLATLISKKVYDFYRKYNTELPLEIRRKIAVHEAGHLLTYFLVFDSISNIKYVTNKMNNKPEYCQRGSFVIKDTGLHTIEDYEKFILMFYGGSASEELVYGFVDIGSGSDKRKAKEFMDIVYGAKNKYTDDPDWGVRDALEQRYNKTLMLLEVNRDLLEDITEAIVEHRILLPEHISVLLRQEKLKITFIHKIKMMFWLYIYYFY